MKNFRYPLRLLLALPLCVAAFYVGWTTRESRIQSEYLRNRTAAEERRRESFPQIARELAERAAYQNDSLDRIERMQRMKTFDRMMNDPARGHLDQMRSF